MQVISHFPFRALQLNYRNLSQQKHTILLDWQQYYKKNTKSYIFRPVLAHH
jgi:hypothetical protein